MTPDGLWRSRGYGWLLRIDEAGFELSHVTSTNRVIAERGTRADFEASFDRKSISDPGAGRPSGRHVLSLHQSGDLTRYDFDRLEVLPPLPTFEPGAAHDALLNFDTLWQTFDEHYAFFDLHGADWAESRHLIRPRVTSGMPDDELIEIFSELLLPLDDGHVSVAAGTHHVQTLKSMELRRALQKTFGLPNARVSPRSTVDAVAPKLEQILLADFPKRTPLKRAGNGIVAWCELEPGVGYLGVLRLFGFADTDAARRADDLPHDRIAVAGFLRDDLAALEKILDEVMRDLQRCRAIVVDLRINGGGFDRAGLAIASRFADAPRVALTKKARAVKGFTPAQEILVPRCARAVRSESREQVHAVRSESREQVHAVQPECREQVHAVQPECREAAYRGPIAVLLSPLCVSAGEICALGFRALPRVQTFGQPTAGMLSDNLNKRLPNGWSFSLSNEVYTAPDGRVFEGRGIPPDRLLPLAPGDLAGCLRAQLREVVSCTTVL